MTATFTATPQQVHQVVAAVLPHASTDKYLPMINCGQLELHRHRFLAVATDRYSLGICRGDLAEWDENAKKVPETVVCLRPDDLKRLFAFLRPHRSDPATWRLATDSLQVSIPEGDSLTLRAIQDIDFVNWRRVIEHHVEKASEPGAPMGFTARVVDNFNDTAKALGEYRMAWHFAGPLQPAMIRIGETFLGLIMPRRMEEDAELQLAEFGIEPKAIAA